MCSTSPEIARALETQADQCRTVFMEETVRGPPLLDALRFSASMSCSGAIWRLEFRQSEVFRQGLKFHGSMHT